MIKGYPMGVAQTQTTPRVCLLAGNNPVDDAVDMQGTIPQQTGKASPPESGGMSGLIGL